MDVNQMSRLLATVSLIDPRVSRRDDNEKELMAKAWLVVVGDEVPYEFAAKCAQDHYKQSSDVFMPVHIVSKWKIEKSKQFEENHYKEITTPNSEAIPMPENVRELIKDMKQKRA